MSNELANSLSLRTEKELLNPHINANTDTMNAYLQTQWDIVRDGLWQGVSQREGQAKDNLLSTGIEAASSVGIAGGLVKAFAAGGKWKLGAEIAGAGFAALTTIDLFRRGAAIHEAYTNSSSDLVGNNIRKNAIAQYAGTGLFDYSLILASAGLGTAAGLRLNSRMPITASAELGSGIKLDQSYTNSGRSNETSSLSEKLRREDSEPRLDKLMDIDKVTDDLAFALDYQISETAMEKISQSLQQANHEEFNDIIRKLEQKDRKFQGMDLQLGNWVDGAQRWDDLRLYYTDENVVTHIIVQKGDTLANIADQETKVTPRRTDKDIKDYITGLMNKNHITEQSNLIPGQILVLPFPN